MSREDVITPRPDQLKLLPQIWLPLLLVRDDVTVTKRPTLTATSLSCGCGEKRQYKTIFAYVVESRDSVVVVVVVVVV